MFYGIDKKYKWYLTLRFIIVLSILLIGFITLRRGLEFNFLPLLFIIIMSILGNIIFFIVLKKYSIGKHDLYIQLLFDNLLVFVIIYYTGGNSSVFNILYFVNIISASYFLFSRGGIILSALSIISYAGILFGEYYGILVSPYNFNISSVMTIDNIIIKLYINAFSFLIIAIISGVLSEKLQYGKEEILIFRLRLKDIINNIPSSIIILNYNYIITDFNNEAKKIFPEISFKKNIKLLDEKIFKDIEKHIYFQFQKDGRFYDIRIEMLKYKNKYENYILIINDISKLKEYEKRIVERKRLSFMGELSASMAHEIRNPLSSIKGSIKIIQEEIPLVKKHPLYHIIIEEIERLNLLINNFLSYSKQSNANFEIIKIKPIINEIIHLLQISNIVKFINIDNKTSVFADINKIRQVFINLLKNSKEAMNNIDNPEIIIKYSRNEEYDIIEVIDNGKSIDKKIQKRMFQLFNSDKQEGTGLGLAIVYKIIVDEHEGKIVFEENNGYKKFIINLRRNND